MLTKQLTNLYETAARVRVKAAWLRAEVEAGRVPCLITGATGRAMLFDPDAVQAELLRRASRKPEGQR